MQMYAIENKDKCMDMSFWNVGEYWMSQLMPYLGEASGQYDPDQQLEVGFCPASKRLDLPDTEQHAKGTAKKDWRFNWAEGSYGLNHWLVPDYPLEPETDYYWSNRYTMVSASVPSLSDCNWVGGSPRDDDLSPRSGSTVNYTLSEGMDPWVGENQLGRHCLNRHGMTVNICFVGGNVEKVPLEELWTLKWHKKFSRRDDIEITKD